MHSKQVDNSPWPINWHTYSLIDTEHSNRNDHKIEKQNNTLVKKICRVTSLFFTLLKYEKCKTNKNSLILKLSSKKSRLSFVCLVLFVLFCFVFKRKIYHATDLWQCTKWKDNGALSIAFHNSALWRISVNLLTNQMRNWLEKLKIDFFLCFRPLMKRKIVRGIVSIFSSSTNIDGASWSYNRKTLRFEAIHKIKEEDDRETTSKYLCVTPCESNNIVIFSFNSIRMN